MPVVYSGINEFIEDIKPFFYRRSIHYVDVGAFTGETFLAFANSEIKIREAVLIEPNPETFIRLKDNVQGALNNNVVVHNIALGSVESELTMRSDESMTRVIDESQKLSREVKKGVVENGEFRVDCKTLDKLGSAFSERKIGLLKIDVEGFELEVLAGAKGLLSEQLIDVIYLEVGMRREGLQQCYFSDVDEFLGEYGYKAFKIYEQMNEWMDDSPLLRRVNVAYMSKKFAEVNPYKVTVDFYDAAKKLAIASTKNASLSDEVRLEKEKNTILQEEIGKLENITISLEHELVQHKEKLSAAEDEMGCLEEKAINDKEKMRMEFEKRELELKEEQGILHEILRRQDESVSTLLGQFGNLTEEKESIAREINSELEKNGKLRDVVAKFRSNNEALYQQCQALGEKLVALEVEKENWKLKEKYASAEKERVKRFMTFRLGEAILKNIGNPLRWFIIPAAIWKAYSKFRTDREKGLLKNNAPHKLVEPNLAELDDIVGDIRSLVVDDVVADEAEDFDFKLSMHTPFQEKSYTAWEYQKSPLDSNFDRPVFALCVTTWNRFEYIAKFVETFLDTRSDKFRWVLIIADDGSVDSTLDYLRQLSIADCQVVVIENKNKTIAGQTNALFEAARSVGFDVGMMCNDDIFFIKEGWDLLYDNAIKENGFDHLVYHNEEWKPARFRQEKGSLVSSVPSIEAMGCLYTFTPKVLKEVGYFDVKNFPFRGHSHMDFTERCCRLGFNENETLWDAKNSQEYVSMWQRDDYKDTVDWNSEKVKKILNAEERTRRMNVVQDVSRGYIPLSQKRLMEPRVNVNIKPNNKKVMNALNGSVLFRAGGMVESKVDAVFVLNLKGQKARWSKMAATFSRHNINFERFDAVNGRDEKHLGDWEVYEKEGLAHPIEKQIGRKLIQSPGAWGYLLTMKKLLETAKERRLKRIMVFDDDVLFHKSFTKNLNKAWGELPADWKLVYLGCSQIDWAVIRPCSKNLYHPECKANGSFAYAIDESVFGLLIDQINRFEWPYDSGPLCEVNKKFPNQTFVITPNVAIADVTDSTIRESRDQIKFAQKAGWDLSDYETNEEWLPNANFDNCVKATICLIVESGLKGVADSLDSICRQTYGLFDLVVVAVDELSVEEAEELNGYSDVDPRMVRLYIKSSKKSNAQMLEDIIENLEGHIGFLKSGDVISPDYIARLLSVANIDSAAIPTFVQKRDVNNNELAGESCLIRYEYSLILTELIDVHSLNTADEGLKFSCFINKVIAKSISNRAKIFEPKAVVGKVESV